MTTTNEVRRTSDAIRERALTDLLNERGLTGPTSATVDTGSDGVCVVTLTMAELDWLTAEARRFAGLGDDDVHEDCGTWTDDDLDKAKGEGMRMGRDEVIRGLEALAAAS